ncbi:tigger transposable element-derived protein 6-like [Dermacentor silvarum]|uniref:tigger transposable element-derived protein 6-like n=1 Tax=Dermacentor silvarum TaxID=543639 RepID=UPI002100CD83|nr:tigger transposable element-derived protein 6-like [Dermacentor silvarum]
MKGESCHGGKVSKDRITVLLCCNEDGSDMMKPWMIGKAKNPTCLRNIARLPCIYKKNTKAWMTCELFESFLRYLDGRLGCKGRSGLLFLDNCAAHPKDTSFLHNLRVVFLPANTTSHLQPLDAGIIKNTKHLYRKCIVRRFLARVSRGQDPGKLSILDAMHYFKTSWESVKRETVNNCLKKCGFRRQPAAEDTECSEDDPVACDYDMDEEFLSTGADVPFAEFVAIDNDVPTCEPQSVAEIVAEVVGDDAAEVVANEAPEDGGDNEGLRPPATFAEALAGLEALQSFFRTKNNENADNGLQCVQKELFLSKGETHQQKITMFCKK